MGIERSTPERVNEQRNKTEALEGNLADAERRDGVTVWGFLAMAAEAWPLLLTVPLALGIAAYYFASAPVQVEAVASLPLPYTELRKLSLRAAVDATLLEPGFELDRSQVLEMLFTSSDTSVIDSGTTAPGLPAVRAPDTSILGLRYVAPLNGEELLERVATAVMKQASLTYLKTAKDEKAEDLANLRAKIAAMEQARASIESALSVTDAVTEDIGGMAAAALALPQISEAIQNDRILKRSLQQDLLNLNEAVEKPVVATTEATSAPDPLRTALLVAIVAETLLLTLVVLWNKVRRLGSEEADFPEIARIRRALGLSRKSR